MKTRGTSNLDKLTDGELRHFIADAALDVYEAAMLFGELETDFALGTFDRFAQERARRTTCSSKISA